VRAARLLRRLRSERGVTLVELITVLLILGTVTGALTTLFVRGTRAELDANNRFQAQQQARVAVDRMRREIHCSSGVTYTASSVTVSLPSQCPSSVGGASTTIVYTATLVSAKRYKLTRAVNGGTAVKIADYITSSSLFSYTAPSAASLGKLTVTMPVNRNPNEGWKTWRLNADIVLRNTLRQ
jgi:type II secretory pathway pseudopilin PulG